MKTKENQFFVNIREFLQFARKIFANIGPGLCSCSFERKSILADA